MEYSRQHRTAKRSVLDEKGRTVTIEGFDLRELGAPERIARSCELRQAAKVTQAAFRAETKRRLELAMSDDPFVRLRARADQLATEIAEDEDEIGELDPDERQVIKAWRARKALAKSAVS